ncbi:MAG: hypothetical protein JJT77_05355 [Crocinitomicaceae bacterium]|nr:hypothetical protein [Crocinitomicaceae bacterium]
MVEQDQTLDKFSPDARVWLYATNRVLSQDEILFLENKLNVFTAQWAAHGKPLMANFRILKAVVVMLVVEESVTAPSGCSIDASVHLMKAIGQELNIDFFDRLNVWLERDGELKRVHISELNELHQAGWLVLDCSEEKLKNVIANWPKPLNDSSYKNFL